jgi:hypothetical protein
MDSDCIGGGWRFGRNATFLVIKWTGSCAKIVAGRLFHLGRIFLMRKPSLWKMAVTGHFGDERVRKRDNNSTFFSPILTEGPGIFISSVPDESHYGKEIKERLECRHGINRGPV